MFCRVALCHLSYVSTVCKSRDNKNNTAAYVTECFFFGANRRERTVYIIPEKNVIVCVSDCKHNYHFRFSTVLQVHLHPASFSFVTFSKGNL